MASTPPVPPAGRAPQGSKNTPNSKTNPKDAKASNHAGNGKQIGVSKATQNNRNSGSR
jgi:hypothetical protein